MMWSLLVLACSVAAEDGDTGIKAPEPAPEVVAEPEQQQLEPWAILLEEIRALPQIPLETPQEAPELLQEAPELPTEEG